MPYLVVSIGMGAAHESVTDQRDVHKDMVSTIRRGEGRAPKFEKFAALGLRNPLILEAILNAAWNVGLPGYTMAIPVAR